jgi:hypothetical protein
MMAAMVIPWPLRFLKVMLGMAFSGDGYEVAQQVRDVDWI